MAIKTVFFDLDGTLLPMDQEKFIEDYIRRLCMYLAPHGYDPKAVADALWKGTAAAVVNDGSITNEKRFWQVFSALLGEKILSDAPIFDRFYREEFPKVKESAGFNPKAKGLIESLKARGIGCVLATNPVFPAAATYHRIRFAGLEVEDFRFVTTFENSSFCKPNPDYYRELLTKLDLKAEECLMVGNDAHEDTAAAKAGLEVFLLTDCLINSKGHDIAAFPHGDWAALQKRLGEI